MTQSATHSIVLAGADHFGADEILAYLASSGTAATTTPGLDRDGVVRAFEHAGQASALIVVLPQPTLGKAFLDIDDAELDAMMERGIDLIATIGVGLAALPDHGAIVVVGNRGYLGGWGGAHEIALSGMAAGFVRSVALAAMPRAIRANLVALDLAGRAPVDPAAAAALTAFLASPASAFVNGEIILANRGRSMLLREARAHPHGANVRPS